jgi:hypothetical protein
MCFFTRVVKNLHSKQVTKHKFTRFFLTVKLQTFPKCIYLSKLVEKCKNYRPNTKLQYLAPSWIGRHFESSYKWNFIHHIKAFPKCIHFLKSVQNCKSYRGNYHLVFQKTLLTWLVYRCLINHIPKKEI